MDPGYHSIHEWRRPNSISLSSATHMATCIAKKTENFLAIPANYNNIPLFNPKNIEASTIIYRLVNNYKGHFDLSYNFIKKEWIQNEMINENDFDQLELLLVHPYNANIEEKKEERSMKTVRILDIKEQNFRSLEDYLSAIKMITDIKSLAESHPPEKNKCDYCDNKFDPNLPECNEGILICGHSYHYDCFETLEKCCSHCTRFYENENNNENDKNYDQESIENININEVINRLLTNAKNEIKNW
nr:2121_t:CDS:2 [Entrophospora candida]